MPDWCEGDFAPGIGRDLSVSGLAVSAQRSDPWTAQSLLFKWRPIVQSGPTCPEAMVNEFSELRWPLVWMGR
jgi:hypothetical protein